MNQNQVPKGLTRKQLAELVNCKPYIIDYLRACGELPIVRQSPGSGTPNLYSHRATDIVRKHLAKRGIEEPSRG